MEGQMAMNALNPITLLQRDDRGQSVVLIAVMMPVIALFILGLLDYAIATVRTQETIAAADLAAHAGAQEITVTYDGTVKLRRGAAANVAAGYFVAQQPGHAEFRGAVCGTVDGRPGCRVRAATKSPGYFLGARVIEVDAIGYLAHGATREGQ